jgi:hypothetical protein
MEGSPAEGQVVDPAEEVVLDPVLVNPIFMWLKRAILVPTALFASSGGVALSPCEVKAMNEMTAQRRHSLAECEN